MTIYEFYKYARKSLSNLDERTFKSDIDIILETYLNLTKTDLFLLKKEIKIKESEFKNLNRAISLRKKNIPIQYIIGNWNFMDINFSVGNGVLIPREDTKNLIDIIINDINKTKNSKIIDLCSGTGCIAITLEKNLKKHHDIYALEYSDDAIKYLKKNIKDNNSNVNAIKGDVFKDYKKFNNDYFDFIVSNPPYIKKKDIIYLQKEVLQEPHIALNGGTDGLDFYKGICKYWSSKIKSGGKIAFEIGIGQFEEIKKIMENNDFKSIEFKKDINNIIRAVMGVKL